MCVLCMSHGGRGSWSSDWVGIWRGAGMAGGGRRAIFSLFGHPPNFIFANHGQPPKIEHILNDTRTSLEGENVFTWDDIVKVRYCNFLTSHVDPFKYEIFKCSTSTAFNKYMYIGRIWGCLGVRGVREISGGTPKIPLGKFQINLS